MKIPHWVNAMQWKIPQFDDFHSTHKKMPQETTGIGFQATSVGSTLERFTHVFANLYGLQAAWWPYIFCSAACSAHFSNLARPELFCMHCSAWDKNSCSALRCSVVIKELRHSAVHHVSEAGRGAEFREWHVVVGGTTNSGAKVRSWAACEALQQFSYPGNWH